MKKFRKKIKENNWSSSKIFKEKLEREKKFRRKSKKKMKSRNFFQKKLYEINSKKSREKITKEKKIT